MQGPWADGDPNQGYQSRMVPAQMYRAAIREIDAHCRSTYSNRNCAALTADEQDKILHGVEKGDVKLTDAPGPVFFELFLSNSTEGFFSDPIYGGNRDMIGWKLIGFPGKETLRSEEHTSELQSLMRNSYAVFCLQKNTARRRKPHIRHPSTHHTQSSHDQNN